MSTKQQPCLFLHQACYTSDLVAKFQHLFTDIGKLKDYKQKLHLDHSLLPVAQKPRRVPFHLRKQASARIEELEALDIKERASGPTSWASPVVAAPKPTTYLKLQNVVIIYNPTEP
jgi:hypothetical protein